jgi:hypothetical protein
LAAHIFSPFSHALEAESFVVLRGIETVSIISQVQANLMALENHQRIELAGVRVTHSVRQNFLADAKEIRFQLWRKFPRLTLQA